MITTAPRPSGRILELDALRGLAALGVVFWHYGAHFDQHPLRTLLFPFYNAGFLLVDFFFVLSGYVIARAYWRPARQWNVFRNIWARIARLYPLHLLTLLATLGLLAVLPPGSDPDFLQPANDLKHLALNLLLLNQVGLQSGWSYNIPAWSISTEFVTNVVFLVAIALPSRIRWVGGILAFAGAAVLLATCARPYIQGQIAFGYLDVNLARCFIGFGAGVAICVLVHRMALEQRLRRLPRLSDVVGLVSILGLLGIMVASGRHPPPVHYLVSIGFAMGCVIFVPFSPLLQRLLVQRPLTFLGDISYSTYLVHYPLQMALYALSLSVFPWIDYASPMVLFGYVASVVGVAALTHRLVELPCQSWLLRLSSPSDGRAPAGVR